MYCFSTTIFPSSALTYKDELVMTYSIISQLCEGQTWRQGFGGSWDIASCWKMEDVFNGYYVYVSDCLIDFVFLSL